MSVPFNITPGSQYTCKYVNKTLGTNQIGSKKILDCILNILNHFAYLKLHKIIGNNPKIYSKKNILEVMKAFNLKYLISRKKI